MSKKSWWEQLAEDLKPENVAKKFEEAGEALQQAIDNDENIQALKKEAEELVEDLKPENVAKKFEEAGEALQQAIDNDENIQAFKKDVEELAEDLKPENTAKKLEELGEALKKAIDDDINIQTLKKDAEELVEDLKPENVAKKLEEFQQEANNQIEQAVGEVKDFVEKTLREAEEIVKIMALLKDIAPDAAPMIGELIEASPSFAANIPAIYRLYDNFNNLSQLPQDSSKEQTQKLVDAIIEDSKNINQIKLVLDTELPKLLENPAITEIAAKLVENGPLSDMAKSFGIDPALVRKLLPEVLDIAKSTVPIATELASKALDKPEDLIKIITNFNEFQRLSNLNEQGESNKQELNHTLTTLFASSGHMLENLKLDENLPKLLKNNKQAILELVDTTISQPKIEKAIKEMKIPKELITNSVGVSTDFIADISSPLIKLTQEILKNDYDSLANIVLKVQDLAKIQGSIGKLEEEKEKIEQTSKTLKVDLAPIQTELVTLNKEMDSGISNLVKESLKLISKDHNNILSKALPDVMAKHAQPLGKVLEEFVNKTKIGKKLHVDGEKTIKVLSGKINNLLEISDLYSKGQFIKIIPKVLDLVFDKEVIKLAIKSLFGKKADKNIENFDEKAIKSNLSKAKRTIKKSDLSKTKNNQLDLNDIKSKTSSHISKKPLADPHLTSSSKNQGVIER
jgi:hypothetical protein